MYFPYNNLCLEERKAGPRASRVFSAELHLSSLHIDTVIFTWKLDKRGTAMTETWYIWENRTEEGEFAVESEPKFREKQDGWWQVLSAEQEHMQRRPGSKFISRSIR